MKEIIIPIGIGLTILCFGFAITMSQRSKDKSSKRPVVTLNNRDSVLGMKVIAITPEGSYWVDSFGDEFFVPTTLINFNLNKHEH